MKHNIFILPLLLLMITSCESAIEYKGSQTAPVVVVSATAKADNDSLKTRVAVSRSYFFLDKTEKFHYNGYEFSYNGYLDNAVVEMRTDNGKWYRLGKTKTPGIYEYNLKGIPQDSITLKVSHKDYGTAVTTQTVPGKVNATIEEIKVRDKRVYIRLKTEPYTGYDNDIIQLCGTFPYYILMPITNYDIDKTTGEYLYTDSVSIQTVLDEKNRIYSEDFIFNELQTSSNGIYSGTALLLTGKQLKQNRNISIFFKIPYCIYHQEDPINITLKSYNFDSFRHFASLGEKRITDSFANEPSTSESITEHSYQSDWIVKKTYDNRGIDSLYQAAMTEIEKLGFVTDNYNIVEDNDENPEDDEDGDIDLTTVLDMAFEELGLAEKRQIYSCFSNGIGVLEVSRTTELKKQIKQ